MSRESRVFLALAGAFVGVMVLLFGSNGTTCRYPAATRLQPIVVPNNVDPQTTSASVENSEASDKVRQAARDFIKERYPKSKAEGVFLLPFRVDNLYIAGVDMTTTTEGGEAFRGTADLLVRLYVRKNGSTYWRAESIGAEEAERLRRQALSLR